MARSSAPRRSSTTAPTQDRWNLVVLGDGFRAADQAAYEAAVTTLVNTLQTTAPYDGSWNRVNVHRVDVHSTDAGADNPLACGDGSAPAGGAATTVKTYFDSSFCNSGIRRLLVCDAGLAVTTANGQVSNWDAILVVVNSTEYGGSGDRSRSTRSRPPQSRSHCTRWATPPSASPTSTSTTPAAPAGRPATTSTRRASRASPTSRSRRIGPRSSGGTWFCRRLRSRRPATRTARSATRRPTRPRSARSASSKARTTRTAAHSARRSTAACAPSASRSAPSARR